MSEADQLSLVLLAIILVSVSLGVKLKNKRTKEQKNTDKKPLKDSKNKSHSTAEQLEKYAIPTTLAIGTISAVATIISGLVGPDAISLGRIVAGVLTLFSTYGLCLLLQAAGDVLLYLREIRDELRGGK
ncbi:MAG: hypothetical protein ACLFQK_09595 [Fibrobacterota bacterium]